MAAPLKVGSKAPTFTLATDGDGTINLKELKGKNVVLFFYPKADTPGCTLEAIAFSKLKASFSRANTVVLGISADPVKAQDKFKKKHDLKVDLIADEGKKAIESYGVWVEKSMYGKKYMGIERTTFLIDSAGKIAQIWDKVKIDGHAQDVLEAAKQLKKSAKT